MEGVDFHMNKVKELMKKEYVSRVRKILQAGMNGDYTMTAIYAYTILVLCYTFGIMKWTKRELRKLDVKTRKMLTMHGIHHPKETFTGSTCTKTKEGEVLPAQRTHITVNAQRLQNMYLAALTPSQKWYALPKPQLKNPCSRLHPYPNSPPLN
eukprot:12002640-Ditylum_brightwellii.AAC.1